MKLLPEAVKRLVTKPATIQYPRVKPLVPENFRGRHIYDKEACIFCRLCEINCPNNAIIVDREKKTWQVDLGKCIFCQVCQDVCPTRPKAVRLGKAYELAGSKKEDFIIRF
jgi:formate hydrogenlyase subunit 6/NADH:ubiquinone oxidoreductase subunit I